MGRRKSHEDYHPYCHHLLQIMVMEKAVGGYHTEPKPRKILTDALSKFWRNGSEMNHAHLLLWNNDKVPSLETLDNFSRYCGYNSWRDFCQQEQNPLFEHFNSDAHWAVLKNTKSETIKHFNNASYSRFLRISENKSHEKLFEHILGQINEQIDISNNPLASSTEVIRLIRVVNQSLSSQNKLDSYSYLKIITQNLASKKDLFQALPVAHFMSKYAKILMGEIEDIQQFVGIEVPSEYWLQYLLNVTSFERDVLVLTTFCIDPSENKNEVLSEMANFYKTIQIYIKPFNFNEIKLYHLFKANNLLNSKQNANH